MRTGRFGTAAIVLRNLRGTVTSDTAGLRLDRFVLSLGSTSSKGLVRRAIEAGFVKVNGAVARRKGRSVRLGETIEVLALPERGEPWVRPDPSLHLEILAEGASWLAVSKPAGMPVYPLRLDEMGTLANALAAHVPICMTIGDIETGMGGILHRLDTNTSGVVLIARTNEAWRRLREQFEAGSVEKVYLAVVDGIVSSPGRLASWLMHTPGRPGYMRVCDQRPAVGGARAMWAVTEFEPVERGRDRTLLRVTIRTGVTHQIRCQLAHLGYPVVGDVRYGRGRVTGADRPTRHWLHAAETEFQDPDDGTRRRLVSPPPAELWQVLHHRTDDG